MHREPPLPPRPQPSASRTGRFQGEGPRSPAPFLLPSSRPLFSPKVLLTGPHSRVFISPLSAQRVCSRWLHGEGLGPCPGGEGGACLRTRLGDGPCPPSPGSSAGATAHGVTSLVPCTYSVEFHEIAMFCGSRTGECVMALGPLWCLPRTLAGKMSRGPGCHVRGSAGSLMLLHKSPHLGGGGTAFLNPSRRQGQVASSPSDR